jgi:hypothetical protein
VSKFALWGKVSPDILLPCKERGGDEVIFLDILKFILSLAVTAIR